MNLAQIKTSHISKRKLFQIERAVVREMTNLWYKQECYFEGNFAENVDIDFTGRRIKITFPLIKGMRHGSPEATVNELMKSLILTMATDPHTGILLENYEYIIGNILDVFVYRIKEIGGRKFLLHRLQTLDLGFRISFGLGEAYYPVSNARHFLNEVLIGTSTSSPEETVETLREAVRETGMLGLKEQGVTFHIIMEKENEASFISLPLGAEQTNYVSLISEHTMRCNIIGSLTGDSSQQPGILKIDAPTHPLQFIRHKGFSLTLDEKALMEKLGAPRDLSKKDFSRDELLYLKLLFNEYVQLAYFLMSSRMIDPGLRLLIIFPRVNLFKIMHEESARILPEEPQTLGELASCHSMLFPLQDLRSQNREKKSYRIPERILQERRVAAIKALAQSTKVHVQTPLVSVERYLQRYVDGGLADQKILKRIHARLHAISTYLKKLHNLQQVVFDDTGKTLELEACARGKAVNQKKEALEEIAENIQIAEVEEMRDVVTTKMLDYLSSVTVKLDQLEKVSSPSIKKEIIQDLQSRTRLVLSQSGAFYRLVLGTDA
ncbi:MAG: hypothetical protein NTZ51_02600 [Proteobacteria bacterium]|nr:hypothetical protein [Pseudomonadota bacterium]